VPTGKTRSQCISSSFSSAALRDSGHCRPLPGNL
jgi:hypothetical protein